MPASSFPTPRMTIRTKVVLVCTVVLAMFALISFISIRSTRGLIDTAEKMGNAHETIAIEERLFRFYLEMENAGRAYVLSADERYINQMQFARDNLRVMFRQLRNPVGGPNEASAKIRELEPLFDESFVLYDALTDVRRERGEAEAVAIFATGRADQIRESIRQTLEELKATENQAVIRSMAATDFIAQATTGAVIAGGLLTLVALVTAFIIILRDVARRKRAEEALAQEHNLLSSIINAMPNYVYVKDVRGRYILDNVAHRRYLGVGDVHAVEGRTVFDYFVPSVAEQFAADDREVIETGKPILNREEPAISLNTRADETWLETTKVPLHDTDGGIIGLVGISSDINERKIAEEQLRRFASQLERSNAELQNFASVASHDLQEPLRKIQTFGDRLKLKCGPQLTEQGLDYLARMQNAAQRMQVLIQDLLKLSRVTSRAQPFEKCNLRAIVFEVLSDLEVMVESKGGKVDVGPLPEIQADPLQMRQLFQNLIANALKFQRPGIAPEVEISGRIFVVQDHLIPGVIPGEEVCQIHCKDNGIGFDAKFADQIFVVFQRLHSRQEYEGTGIGLAVCRKITDRHGGTIVAKSAEGEGATFIVTLPVKQLRTPTHD